MSTIGNSARRSDIEAYDPAPMMARINADMRLFAELVQMFLEDYPPLIAEIRSAIAVNDAVRFKSAAHTLRGAIGNFTTGKPYLLAGELESMANARNAADALTALERLNDSVERLADALKQSALGQAP